jgi:hypothetical protein
MGDIVAPYDGLPDNDHWPPRFRSSEGQFKTNESSDTVPSRHPVGAVVHLSSIEVASSDPEMPDSGSPAVHHKQFTANSSPQGRFIAEAIHRKAIYCKQFTTIFFKVGQFTAEQVHRKQFTAGQYIEEAIFAVNNSLQGNSPQRQFTAESIHRRAIHCKNNSPQIIHRFFLK